MEVSVIIATMNRPEGMRDVLASLVAQTLKPTEIILVDQSTDNRTKELADRYQKSFPRLRYVRQEEKSLVKARNKGLSIATGTIISFLDDDVVLFKDYYERIVNYFLNDDYLGGLSGTIVNLEPLKGWKWQLRKILLRIFLIDSFDGKMTSSGFGYPIYDRLVNTPVKVELLYGCDMNFQRDALQDKKFDEWFYGYSFREDTDFSYEISKKYKLLLVPDAKLFHQLSPQNRLDKSSLKKMQFANYYHVFCKHKRKNSLSVILFYYSFTGHVLMDLIKFLLSRKRVDFHGFRTGLIAYWDSVRKAITGKI